MCLPLRNESIELKPIVALQSLFMFSFTQFVMSWTNNNYEVILLNAQNLQISGFVYLTSDDSEVSGQDAPSSRTEQVRESLQRLL